MRRHILQLTLFARIYTRSTSKYLLVDFMQLHAQTIDARLNALRLAGQWIRPNGRLYH